MIKKKLLDAIKCANEDRDLHLDDLNDVIEHADITELQAMDVVGELISLIGVSSNSAEHESLLNLLGTLYFKGRAIGLIEKLVEERMDFVDDGSLVHCIEIISESSLPTRQERLKELLRHQNPVVRQLAQGKI
jgi:hypothetical protein